MRFRRVTLLVAIYLALDFANPMMPGAVQIVEGSLAMVAGVQARIGETPVVAVTMASCYLSSDLPQLEPSRRRALRRVVSISPPVPVFFRVSLESCRSTPALSSDDD